MAHTPTHIEQTEEQRRASFEAAGLAVPDTAISVQDLEKTQSAIQVPEQPPAPDRRPTVDAGLQGILDQFKQEVPEEAVQTDLQSRILDITGTLGGQKERQQELEAEAGLGEQRTELQGVIGQLQGLSKEAQAIPLQIQQEFAGRGATRAGVAPIQTARLRENAIKSLGLSAIGQTLQGNISLAQSSIQQALDAEFEPEERKLATLQQLYTFNRDALERTDKKRADQLNLVISERNRQLELDRLDKEEIFNIGLIAQQNGAPTNVVQQAFESGNREEALGVIGQYIQDPQAKLNIQTSMLNNQLKRAQIDQTIRATALLGQTSDADLKEDRKALKEAKASIPVMQDKIVLIDALKKHDGLSGTVGAYNFARFTPIKIDKGARLEFAGSVHKLVSGLSLDSLIEAKSRGATFGALSDRELTLLANAATAINDWEIKGEDGVTGTGRWEIDEASFVRELDRIQNLTQEAVRRKQGGLFDESEMAFINETFIDIEESNPAGFFNTSTPNQI